MLQCWVRRVGSGRECDAAVPCAVAGLTCWDGAMQLFGPVHSELQGLSRRLAGREANIRQGGLQ